MWHVWGRGEVHTGCYWGNVREGDHLDDTGVDWKIILKWIFKMLVGGMDWIDLAQDRDRWLSSLVA
jgi:hypothetical protein